MQTVIDLQQLVDVIGDAVIASDVDGVITMWNPAATRIFGFTEAEALGQSLDLIIPEQQRNSHWNGYHTTMQTGETRYATDVLRVPAVHKEGRRLSIALTVVLEKRDAELSEKYVREHTNDLKDHVNDYADWLE